MTRVPALVAVFLTVAASVSIAADPTPIELDISSRAQLDHLSSMVTIENLRNGSAEALATPAQLAELDRLGIPWRPATPPKLAAITMCPAGWVADSARLWNCYPSYQQYVGLLEKLAADYPDLCRLEWIGGTTNQVRPHDLWALRITDQPDADEDEPEVLLTSTMHGDETAGFPLLLRMADELLTSYGDDPELTNLVDEVDLWLNPNANPDGTYAGGDHTVAGAIRYYTTSAGASSFVNPNRNFPDPVVGDHADGSRWWIETEAMMALASAHSFVLSANFHGGAEVVNYPWDSTSRRHVDDGWFRVISREYADLAQAASPGGYLTDLDNGITNGWDWYSVFGGRQDYVTYFHGGRELTIELSAVKLLGSERLEDHWVYNRDALYAYVGRSLEGIRGLVTDPDGAAVTARVEVIGHDQEQDRSWVMSDPDTGDYHRLLLPGTFGLRFSATGFVSQEVAGLAVIEGTATRHDVVLVPETGRDVSGVVRWRLGRRPVAGAMVEVSGLSIEAVFTDSDGRYTLPAVPFGEVKIRVTADGAHAIEADREVTGDPVNFDFRLLRAGQQTGQGSELKRGGG